MHCGITGTAGNLLEGLPFGQHGHFGREALTSNVSAISGDCLFARREIYEEVGLLEEELFKDSLYDVDFCLKILEKGYQVVYNPYVELIAVEPKIRQYENTSEKQEKRNFLEKWKDLSNQGDPYYNSNFSRDNGNFTIKVKE